MRSVLQFVSPTADNPAPRAKCVLVPAIFRRTVLFNCWLFGLALRTSGFDGLVEKLPRVQFRRTLARSQSVWTGVWSPLVDECSVQNLWRNQRLRIGNHLVAVFDGGAVGLAMGTRFRVSQGSSDCANGWQDWFYLTAGRSDRTQLF